MKKLKNKVFFTIFTIMTLFVLIITTTMIVRNYVEKKETITEILINAARIPNKNKDKIDFPSNEKINGQDTKRIYLDFTIYTIILDRNGNFGGIINHTNNDEFDSYKIETIANDIIDKHIEDFFVGNLFIDNYAYFFTPNNTLIIIDNTNLNKILVNEFIIYLMTIILCEIIILIITYIITKWITIPVKKSFEQQKIFVADASHELKTPLSVILASADAYLSDKNDKWVYNIKNESERMTKLVKELLDLAKTEEDVEIMMQETNLSDIVEGTILTFESLFYENHIKLKYEIEPNIKILCNEDLISELMYILIDNSIKHCDKVGKVFINLFKNNKHVILEIKNTGLPISKEHESKIFERFYKVDSSRNRNSDNYGLGLAIAKNIVEKHNGSISAHSSDGYTTFKIIWNQK